MVAEPRGWREERELHHYLPRTPSKLTHCERIEIVYGEGCGRADALITDEPSTQQPRISGEIKESGCQAAALNLQVFPRRTPQRSTSALKLTN